MTAPPGPKLLGSPAARWALALARIALAFALLFGADVASKTWAEHDLRRQGARSALGGVLVLRYQTNSGIAFGLFRAPIVHWKRDALIAYKVVMIGVLLVLLVRRIADPEATRLVTGGLVLLLAGTAGNLRDRIERGAVIDFLDLQLPGGIRWPAFNLADLYLALGVAACAWGLYRAHRQAAVRSETEVR